MYVSCNVREMLETTQLKHKALHVGLRVNMNNYQTPCTIPPSFICISYPMNYKITLGRENQTKEVDKRITQTWVTSDILAPTFSVTEYLKEVLFFLFLVT